MLDINTAAWRLFNLLEAPKGSLNVAVFEDRDGSYIRVLVAPEFYWQIFPVPESFESYRVSLEKRGQAFAQAQ